jgi:hypothetical protein
MTVKEQIVQAVQTGWTRYDNGSFMADRLASEIADELLRIWPVPVEAPVPSPGYVDREIVQGAENEQFGEYLTYTYLKQSCPLDWASRHPGFMGYVIEGRLHNAPIIYVHKKGSFQQSITLVRWASGDWKVLRASHVRFAVK